MWPRPLGVRDYSCCIACVISLDLRADQHHSVSNRSSFRHAGNVSDTKLLPDDLLRPLVRTQPAPTRLPQPSVGGPLAVAHLTDQLRSDECHPFSVLSGKPCIER